MEQEIMGENIFIALPDMIILVKYLHVVIEEDV